MSFGLEQVSRWVAVCVVGLFLVACGDAGDPMTTAGSGGTASDGGPADGAIDTEPDATTRDASADEDAGERSDASADAATDSSTSDSAVDGATTTPAELGAACANNEACGSGYCVDGLCCDGACEADCMACASALTGVDDGSCAPIEAGEDPDDECEFDPSSCSAGTCNGQGACAAMDDGAVCRANTGPCDLAETCSAGVCPSDLMVAETEQLSCRAAVSSCDVPEVCDGLSKQCPTDAVAPSETVCRSAIGLCDLNEVCDGVSNQCPTNTFASTQTVCRTSAGPCDVTEYCSGAGVDCPGDGMATGGTTCRPSAGGCDLVETCNGYDAACPNDVFVESGTECRGTQGMCDVPEVCSGNSAQCPIDQKSSAVCRTSTGTCDATESCDGVTNNCPSDGYLSSTSTACGAQYCTGDSNACVACRNTGDCGDGEVCDMTNACVTPKLVFSTSTGQAGNLGGLVGADAICQTRADAASLPGTYKAWLSTTSVSASSRLTHASVPYYMPNGTKIADNWDDLVDSSLDAGITVTEFGVAVPNNRPYTGTGANGTVGGGSHCLNWTSNSAGQTALMGQSASTNQGWTSTVYLACNTLARLVCFQQ